MTLTVELTEIEAIGDEAFADATLLDERRGMPATLGGPRSGFARSVLVPALAMSAACVATVSVASTLRRGSPWAGLQAIASGIGVVGERPPKHFEPRAAIAAIGMVTVGSLFVAQLSRRIGPKVRGGVIGQAALVAIASFGIDRLLLRRSLLPALENSLGRAGTITKYAAMGIAAALARRSSVR